MIRSLILAILRWSGFMWWWRFRHRHAVIILAAHGTMTSESRTHWVPLRPQFHPRRLEASIKCLSRYYRFVSLQDAVEMLAGRAPLRPYTVALTFDDGYRNNITHALPILRRLGVPATFFLATGHVEGRKPFWFDRLDYALQHGHVDGREVRIGPETIRLRATDRADLQRSYKQLRDAAKGLQRHDMEMLKELEDLAAELESESGRKLADIFEGDDWSAVLTWEEVRRAAGKDVSFGSHTVDHIRLGLVDGEIIRDQLICSRRMLEERTGQTCDYLCYPSGSFGPLATAAARECGYVAAVTTVEGTNRVGDDPMTLRRIGFPNTDSVTETLAVVSGLSIAISRCIARIRARLGRRASARDGQLVLQ